MHVDTNIPVEERLFILSKVFQSIPIYFAHWEDAFIQPEELDNTFKLYLQKVLSADTRIEFSKIMYELFGLLNNGHTSFRDATLANSNPELGFSMAWIDGRWIVTESQIQSLHAGDEMIQINNISVEEMYREMEKYIRCGSERSTRMAFGSGWWRVFSFPLKYDLTWEDREGNRHIESIDREALSAYPHDNSTTDTEGRWIIPNDIAYIRIPSFDDSKYESTALQYVSEYKDARVLIVDVRSNPGGSTPLQLRKSIIDKPYRYGSYSSPQHIGIQQAWAGWGQTHVMWMPTIIQPEVCLFHGKLYVLVNRETASAAEDLVNSIKWSERGTVVGEPTYGSSGQPVFFDCGNEMSFRIGAIRGYQPDGSRFEGVGIQPDILIEPTRKDIYEGRDRVFEFVVEETRRPDGHI